MFETSSFSFLFKLLLSNINNVADTKNASPSETGPAYKTPITPNVLDNIIAADVKNSICLDSVKNADFAGFPIAWKKIPDAI